MENQIPTSFIPKQAIVSKPAPERASGGAGMGLVTTLSFLVLFVSIALAGGVFSYKMMLQSNINRPCPSTTQIETSGCGLLASLEVDKRNLDRELLLEMERFDAKLKTAKGVLAGHITLIPFFDRLGRLTLKTVQFSSFDIKDGVVTMKGSTRTYENVAVQANLFNTEKSFKDILFSDLDVNAAGNVAFKVTFKVAPEMLAYSNYLAGEYQKQLNAAGTATGTTVTLPAGDQDEE